jgi:Rps23 Pro-64 3,4-dihydroxylase Tpa1-like proline 4-hydroxylase
MHIKVDIGAKKNMIKRYKDILDNESFNGLWNDIKNSPWWYDHRTTKGKTIFFSQHIQENYIFKYTYIELCKKIHSLISKDISEKIYPIWMKVNGQVHGQSGDFHKDYNDDGFYTFVYFPIPYWNVSWGGEFVIYDSIIKEYEYMPPLPNHGILFPSNYDHMGSDPNRHCDIIRISIALNFCTEKNIGSLKLFDKKIIEI